MDPSAEKVIHGNQLSVTKRSGKGDIATKQRFLGIAKDSNVADRNAQTGRISDEGFRRKDNLGGPKVSRVTRGGRGFRPRKSGAIK